MNILFQNTQLEDLSGAHMHPCSSPSRLQANTTAGTGKVIKLTPRTCSHIRTSTPPPPRYLARLLLVHGRTCCKWNAEAVQYSFYKNFAMTITFILYAFVTAYSCQVGVRLSQKGKDGQCWCLSQAKGGCAAAEQPAFLHWFAHSLVSCAVQYSMHIPLAPHLPHISPHFA